jgi:pimeloyl-ACP methyl ester carboxylesterase
MRVLMNRLLYLPARKCAAPPGLRLTDVTVPTEDGERLHAWWVPASGRAIGHVLLCHGNAGNLADRAPHIALLTAAGFDVLAFDYRGYGRSSGRPSEEGTYRDARAAREALLRQAGVEPPRILYVGESLGGAVALALALERPPGGLVLQSAFTSVRAMARLHYPLVPRALVPDAYPNLRRIRALRAPLLVLHGSDDRIVPVMDGEALYEAAPGPKHIEVFAGVGHNDLIARAGARWIRAISAWWNSR